MDLFGDFWYVWVLPFVGGIIWYLITKAAVKAPGTMLQAKFANLTKDTNGVIAGKTYQQIVAACGAPSSAIPAREKQSINTRMIARMRFMIIDLL